MPVALIAAALASTALPSLIHYKHVALDPAGRTIASVDSAQVKGAPGDGHGAVILRDTAGKVIGRHDPCAGCRYDDLAWSPDGAALAFIASGGGSATVYLAEKGGLRKIATVRGLASALRWSPDGSTITPPSRALGRWA